jgi:hypothetical protein
MTEYVKEPDLQTITAVGKVSVTDNSTALLLWLAGLFCNKALEHRRVARQRSLELSGTLTSKSQRLGGADPGKHMS